MAKAKTTSAVKTLAQREGLLKAMALVNKQFGEGTMAIASTVNFAHRRRLSTGIFNLDRDTGGGLPKGRITMLIGDESSGKSTICTLVAANAQQTCKQCMGPFTWRKDGDAAVLVTPCGCGASEPHTVAYLDIEGTFDPDWAAKLGLMVSEVILVQPEYAEQGADQVTAVMRSGELDLLIIDSIAMMTPAAELKKSAGELLVGTQAKIVNRAMRSIQSAFNSLGMSNVHKPAVLQVNQYREKVGVMFGPTETIPGGRGQKFAASITIETRAGKKIDSKGKPGGEDPTKVGVELSYNVSKNKTYAAYKRGSYQLYTSDAPQLGVRAGHINNFEQIVLQGQDLDVLGQSGAWFDLTKTFGSDFRNPDSGNGKFQGVAAVIAFLVQNEARARVVRERILHEVQGREGGSLPPLTEGEDPSDEVLDIPE